MAVKEKDLPQVASLSGVDYVRAVSSGGTSEIVPFNSIMQIVYPVGSYYETSDASFDPNVTFGGTWVLEAEGLVHIGAGSNYNVGDTGGETTHTLTVSEIPNHNHKLMLADNTGTQNGYPLTVSGSSVKYTWNTARSEATGGGNAHNNMQPYIVVNRWHRTA